MAAGTRYRGEATPPHGDPGALGVLLSNLGTPAAPTARALRPYLRQFLLDPRVIELPRALWWTILHLFVLTRRPKQSAALYAQIWTPEGSPLLVISRRQAAGLERRLAGRARLPIRVALGMRYGEPSLGVALAELAARGCRRILSLPLYPQYSGPTVGSSFDGLVGELVGWRWVPELRTIHGYHDEPGYVAALAASIDELWRRDGGAPDRLLFSFHGMPRRYFDGGDPYYCCCQKSARLVTERLGFPAERTIVAFQSRFGREEWLRPYTDETLAALPGDGVASVDVVCPGFAADCLETLEEIDGLNRKLFLGAGGARYRYVPCLNDRADHLDFLADLAARHLAGWLELPVEAGDPAASARASAGRAEAHAARLAGEEGAPARG